MSKEEDISLNFENEAERQQFKCDVAIEELIAKYKNRITKLRRKRDMYERKGRAGACLAITGEIQAYNAVIRDLEEQRDK